MSSIKTLFKYGQFETIAELISNKKNEQITSPEMLEDLLLSAAQDNDLKLYMILHKHPMYKDAFHLSKYALLNKLTYGLSKYNNDFEFLKLILNESYKLPEDIQIIILKNILSSNNSAALKFYFEYPRFHFYKNQNVKINKKIVKFAFRVSNLTIIKLFMKYSKLKLPKNSNRLLDYILRFYYKDALIYLINLDSFGVYGGYNAIYEFLEFLNKGSIHQVDMLKILLFNPKFDPSIDNNLAIKYACKCGHDKAVEILLTDPRVDPSVDNNYSIRKASKHGHIKVIKLLLADQRVDPSTNNNEAYKYVVNNGLTELIPIFYKQIRI